MAYTTSTQFYNWYFDPADLASHRQNCNSTARKQLAERLARVDVGAEKPVDDPDELAVGLDADEELLIVKRYIFLMRALFEKFVHPSLPEEVFGFAVTYFKRFYLNHSVMDFYPREMMLTCLYVACKAADFPVGLQAFIAHIPRNQERYSHFIINSELFLLESLNYDLWVFTPYRPLMGLIIDLVAYQEKEQEDRLPFLFVLIKRRTDGALQCTVYKESYLGEQYLHFSSFATVANKRGLVKTPLQGQTNLQLGIT